MRSAVIFGGGGFIGSNYYSQFCCEFDRITIIDRFYGPSHSSLAEHQRLRQSLRPQDQIFTADVADIRYWPELLRDATHIFILNADTGTGNSYLTPSMTIDENLRKLAVLIEAIRAHCNKDAARVMFTSSRAVYGEGHWRCEEHGHQQSDRSPAALASGNFAPLCSHCRQRLTLRGSLEEDPEGPLSVYGLTKASGERLLALTLANAGFDVRIVRYQNVYGIGQAIDNPYTGVLNWISKALLHGSTVKIYEQGLIVRDFIFVSDAAALLHRLASIERPGQSRNQPYVVNGGTGVATRLADAAWMLKEIYESNSEVVLTNDFRLGDVLGAVADTTRANNELGHATTVTLHEGLVRYAQWFRSHHKALQ